MTDHIQVHSRVRIREGELDGFLEAAAKFVELINGRAGTDSICCYVDRDTRTVSWFEVFHNVDGYLAHLAGAEDPAFQALIPEMIPRVEEFERNELYGPVPAEVRASLAEMGAKMGFETTWVPAHAGFIGKGR